MGESLPAILLFAVPTAFTGVTLFRLSRQRIDRIGSASGDAGFPLIENVRVWDPDRYNDDGKRMLPLLYVGFVLQIICYSLAVAIAP